VQSPFWHRPDDHQLRGCVQGPDDRGPGAGEAHRATREAIRGFNQDDRVYAYSFASEKGGFYAEYVAVPAPRVGHVPKRLDLKEAGAIGTTGLTALQGVERLGVRKHQPIIIVGAAGGVGSLAVQFALRWLGAHVLAVVSPSSSGSTARSKSRKLKVPIGAEFPLAQAAKAHQRIEAGHVLGKIVLRIRSR
jgi:NADPH:quinone reductase-like Zn-dependent oxidoreductase